MDVQKNYPYLSAVSAVRFLDAELADVRLQVFKSDSSSKFKPT